MADTSQPELSEPHTNGVMDGLTEEEKSKMRPADIDAVILTKFLVRFFFFFVFYSVVVAFLGYEGNGEKEESRDDDEFAALS